MSEERHIVDIVNILKTRIKAHCGLDMQMVLIQGGDFEAYQKACRLLGVKHNVVVTVNVEDRDLYRIPYWDVEFNWDYNRKKWGVTGDYEKIKAFLGDEPIRL